MGAVIYQLSRVLTYLLTSLRLKSSPSSNVSLSPLSNVVKLKETFASDLAWNLMVFIKI